MSLDLVVRYQNQESASAPQADLLGRQTRIQAVTHHQTIQPPVSVGNQGESWLEGSAGALEGRARDDDVITRRGE